MITEIDGEELSCEDCGESAVATLKVPQLGGMDYIAPSEPDTENTSFRQVEGIGWLCSSCRRNRRQRRIELRKQPKQGPPEPPDEWRFCQACGEQIDPTKIDGQYCSEHTNRKESDK